jgi:hypothetical protein
MYEDLDVSQLCSMPLWFEVLVSLALAPFVGVITAVVAWERNL